MGHEQNTTAPQEPLKLTPTLTERESYLVSRIGDAWVELNRNHYDLARDELAEAQVAADDVIEAAAKARVDAAELRAALEGIVELLSKPNTDSLRGMARRVGAIAIARAALAATEGSE